METEPEIVCLRNDLFLLPAGLNYYEIRVGLTTDDGRGMHFIPVDQRGQTQALVTAEKRGKHFRDKKESYVASTEVAGELLAKLHEINDLQDAGELDPDAVDDAAGPIQERLRQERIIAARKFAENHPELFKGIDISKLAEVVIEVDTLTE